MLCRPLMCAGRAPDGSGTVDAVLRRVITLGDLEIVRERHVHR